MAVMTETLHMSVEPLAAAVVVLISFSYPLKF